MNFSDGEIYLQLRQYNDVTDRSESALFAKQRMLARLSAAKRKDLRQMLNNEALTKAFDALRVLPALWEGFRIEHKFLSMKCHEVRTVPPLSPSSPNTDIGQGAVELSQTYLTSLDRNVRRVL